MGNELIKKLKELAKKFDKIQVETRYIPKMSDCIVDFEELIEEMEKELEKKPHLFDIKFEATDFDYGD